MRLFSRLNGTSLQVCRVDRTFSSFHLKATPDGRWNGHIFRGWFLFLHILVLCHTIRQRQEVSLNFLRGKT
jgi:hypothetical protein